MFDAVSIKNAIVQWIRDYFERSGPNSPCIIGISGGKDSTITAALCVSALGRERVFGVLMPNSKQKDIETAKKVCKTLGIKYHVFNIGAMINIEMANLMAIPYKDFKRPNDTVLFNNPARIRMCVLYAIANQVGGRVANTCNMSETYVGYDTAWGDQCGDFSPLQNLTVTEVREIGRVLGLPAEFVEKPPSDGMCGQTDEDRFGFTYDDLDAYLRGGAIRDTIQSKIEAMHSRAEFKNVRVNLPSFPYFPEKSRRLK